MVLAGTQGGFNHKKTDRLISIAKKGNLPIIFFVEGGGGRPGDVDFDAVKSQCSAITPVPGGVGPMTRYGLLFNTLKSYKKKQGL